MPRKGEVRRPAPSPSPSDEVTPTTRKRKNVTVNLPDDKDFASPSPSAKRQTRNTRSTPAADTPNAADAPGSAKRGRRVSNRFSGSNDQETPGTRGRPSKAAAAEKRDAALKGKRESLRQHDISREEHLAKLAHLESGGNLLDVKVEEETEAGPAQGVQELPVQAEPEPSPMKVEEQPSTPGPAQKSQEKAVMSPKVVTSPRPQRGAGQPGTPLKQSGSAAGAGATPTAPVPESIPVSDTAPMDISPAKEAQPQETVQEGEPAKPEGNIVQGAASPPATENGGLAVGEMERVRKTDRDLRRERDLAKLHQSPYLQDLPSEPDERLKKVMERLREVQKTVKRVPKCPEPMRPKVHWDYLLEEMQWLSKDFSEERKFKISCARKISRAVLKYWVDQANKDVRKEKDKEVERRRRCSQVAKMVRRFWSQIEQVVEYKHDQATNEIKKQNEQKKLDLLLATTERYSSKLAQSLNAEDAAPAPAKPAASPTAEKTASSSKPQEAKKPEGDGEFVVKDEEADNEDTLEADEKMFKPQEIKEEVDALQKESEMPVEELLKQMMGDGSYEGSTSEDDDDEDEDEDDDDEDEEDGDEEGVAGEEGGDGDAMDVDDEIKKATVKVGGETTTGDEMKQSDDESDNEPLGTGNLLDEDKENDEKRMQDAAEAATSAQPTGYTLATMKVKTKVPFLLRAELREYQHIGLDWLNTMYEKKLNGILADEMGLGKTIQTISMLTHLACEKGIWGPHLIVVPTSVMLNWEMEFKRFAPAFKLLTYYGTQKERKQKRQGWTKPNSFHVCITSYKIVTVDHQAFRRKKWKYFILDEAQHIKNFKSQRWQTLLNFNSKRRLLLTGTPLQNSLMELWSLMHFLMPHVFQSHKEFKDLFSNPLTSMVEGQEEVNQDLIQRLHGVLRPFLLRRLKCDVEKQLPNKYEHIIPCQLSKRQRNLYEEYMSNVSTQKTLSSGNFLGIANCLMQLRKVCNHPDLFEGRSIVSPFDMEALVFESASLITKALEEFGVAPGSLKGRVNLLDGGGLAGLESLVKMGRQQAERTAELKASKPLIVELSDTVSPSTTAGEAMRLNQEAEQRVVDWHKGVMEHHAYVNDIRCSIQPVYGWEVLDAVDLQKKITTATNVHIRCREPKVFAETPTGLRELVHTPESLADDMDGVLREYVFAIPRARAPPMQFHVSHPSPAVVEAERRDQLALIRQASPMTGIYRVPFVRMQMYFPDKRLVQFDCGKLQALDRLCRKLKAEGHRALIFTQMSKMLDTLEAWVNLYNYTYLRLDGTTKPETRQRQMEMFNNSDKYFLFILSTRSGGVGINLTGADTVIFYDSDWNPAMDAQAQDRAHRIGQTREVNIYRLVSEHTIEENIVKKANQKRHLDALVIEEGGFTTEFFKKTNLRDLFDKGDPAAAGVKAPEKEMTEEEWTKVIAKVEDEGDVQATLAANSEKKAEIDEFNENLILGPDDVGTSADLTGQYAQSEEAALMEQSILENLKPVERFALQFLEIEKPFIPDDIPELQLPEAMDIDEIDRLKEQEENDDDDENDEEEVFYEATGDNVDYCRQLLLTEQELWGPPTTDGLESLFMLDVFDDQTYGLYDPDGDDERLKRDRKAKKKAAKEEKRRDKELEKKNTKIKIAFKPGDKDSKKRKLEDRVLDSDYDTDELEGLNLSKKEKEKLRKRREEKRRKEEEARQEEGGRVGMFSRAGKANRKNISRKTTNKNVVSVSDSNKSGTAWSSEEDTIINTSVKDFGMNWPLIADILNISQYTLGKRRSARQCSERWRLVLEGKQGKGAGDDDKPAPSKANSLAALQNSDIHVQHFAVIASITQKKRKNAGRGLDFNSQGPLNPNIIRQAPAQSKNEKESSLKPSYFSTRMPSPMLHAAQAALEMKNNPMMVKRSEVFNSTGKDMATQKLVIHGQGQSSRIAQINHAIGANHGVKGMGSPKGKAKGGYVRAGQQRPPYAAMAGQHAGQKAGMPGGVGRGQTMQQLQGNRAVLQQQQQAQLAHQRKLQQQQAAQHAQAGRGTQHQQMAAAQGRGMPMAQRPVSQGMQQQHAMARQQPMQQQAAMGRGRGVPVSSGVPAAAPATSTPQGSPPTGSTGGATGQSASYHSYLQRISQIPALKQQIQEVISRTNWTDQQKRAQLFELIQQHNAQQQQRQQQTNQGAAAAQQHQQQHGAGSAPGGANAPK